MTGRRCDHRRDKQGKQGEPRGLQQWLNGAVKKRLATCGGQNSLAVQGHVADRKVQRFPQVERNLLGRPDCLVIFEHYSVNRPARAIALARAVKLSCWVYCCAGGGTPRCPRIPSAWVLTV